MSEYQAGGTVGGKLGCAVAGIVGVPLIALMMISMALGGGSWPEFLIVIAIITFVGLIVRTLVNWIVRRLANES